jgi:hypothetical protein
MGATGTTELDFGAFPGASHATVAVTGQASIVSGSLVEAWIRPIATTDHTADEHMVETIKVFAADIVAGVGFTIHGFNTSQLNEPLMAQSPSMNTIVAKRADANTGSVGGTGTRIYGKFTVAWVWN